MLPVVSSAAKQPPVKNASPSQSPSRSQSPSPSQSQSQSPSPPPSQSPSSFPLTSLPNDLALNCLARVSSSELAALPLVSKKYRPLVASSDFKNMRSLVGCIEECLYICLDHYHDLTSSWYVIRRDKSKTLKDENPFVLSPIPPCPSPRREASTVVLGWDIYVIGGYLGMTRTSNVMLLDCRTNTWRNVPSMRVPRGYAAAGVVDGKIYVFGGCSVKSSKWGEVFDPKTQTWETLEQVPFKRERDDFRLQMLVVEGKVCAVSISKKCLVSYSPSEGKWGSEFRPDLVVLGDGHYVWDILCGCGADLGKLLFGCDITVGKLYWRALDEMEWKKVKGLEALEKNFTEDFCISQVSNFGVNIFIIWVTHTDTTDLIWGSEISFKRVEEKGEVWGTIEWSGLVAIFDKGIIDRHPLGPVLCSGYVTV